MSRVRRRRAASGNEERLSWSDLHAQWMLTGGLGAMNPVTTYGDQTIEGPPNSFEGYVQAGYKGNGIVFAVLNARLRLFTEARFAWRDWSNGKPGTLYTNQALDVLQRPWPNGTTGDLLAHMEQDASLNGQFYAAYRNDGRRQSLRRLRPDWVDIVINSPNGDPFDIDAEVVGYTYWPDGRGSRRTKPVFMESRFVVHYAPIPDPEARFRGMSWLSPIVEEIRSDSGMTRHKGKFLDNAATPNLSVSIPKPMAKAEFMDLVDAMDSQHKGLEHAYKTLWLMGGADVKVIGADLKQIDFRATQGAGETRIAAAAGVPPVIVGLSEGLAAATYSNYGQARRAFADLWARPSWRAAAAALQPVLAAPNPASELWYDESGISFLQEDLRDDAEIKSLNAQTIRTLVDAGYDPQTVIGAVESGDFSRLSHSGLFSVQLQGPGA